MVGRSIGLYLASDPSARDWFSGTLEALLMTEFLLYCTSYSNGSSKSSPFWQNEKFIQYMLRVSTSSESFLCFVTGLV